MRDWLALPLSPTSSFIQSKSGSSDELMTTDDETYDIISKATTTEDEIEEELDEENEEDEVSSWLSILNVFSRKVKTSSATTSCSSSITHDPVAHEKALNEDDGDSYRADEDDNELYAEERELIQDINNIRDMDDQVHLHSSASSISTDTDHSTPANSQIISSSSSKYYHQQERILTDIKIYWNHGGKKVQVTGEFDNWSASVNMVQDTKDMRRHVVEIPMDLAKDIEFKFIVDGEWRYAADLPHRTDWRGNVNNVIYKRKPLSTT